MRKRPSIKQGWSLFLDRDGVINQRIPDDYVKHPDEFEFIPGVTDALQIFAGLFNPIIVITNQQGIGRGLMTSSHLDLVHKKMLQKVTETGGRVDAVFYSPDLKNQGSFTRKPAVGLGLKARKQFPAIDFKRSIMAGDSYSDILFGHRLGMSTVLIGMDKDVMIQYAGILDYSFPDLISFAEYIKENIK
jgi:D-glycero-D-manno-heptose 1,7-bisphosphate phosphatase